MGKLDRYQKGFSVIEVLFTLIIIAAVVSVGAYLYNRHNAKTDKPVAKTSTSTKPAVNTDPTTSWATYTSVLGKFSVRYPKEWATATTPEACTNTTQNGIFLLGANKSSVGACASDNTGQMTITWRTDRTFCGDLNVDAWAQDSKQPVAINGQSGVKIEATAKAPGAGLGTVPEGTKTVQYCVVANNETYVAEYMQLSTYPDVLSDFNTMITKTLKFN